MKFSVRDSDFGFTNIRRTWRSSSTGSLNRPCPQIQQLIVWNTAQRKNERREAKLRSLMRYTWGVSDDAVSVFGAASIL